ncbi:hypothetical protein HBA55_02235 [Pseudomaricurvus alkylphenolicus]|uniref:N,N-dimethylformamidase beta subunit family domain-containing protein n=1 Tax=Pseudomaricurvus alkylphenolicus TaxID=1306991 RepID=UPI00141F688E|nr:N,N-dimethylformamidase beta subunit family domain-containing protein [Pseudomaricurvus alkylphenolicus]NIB38382.1 hypothetical protein [Pseudomaricurvus alkylphenolicus]
MSNPRVPRGQWPSWTLEDKSEYPSDDPTVAEVWGYTGKFSYAPGEALDLHVNCSGRSYSIEIFRDGATWESVYRKENIPAEKFDTPQNSYEVGCGWPTTHSFIIPSDWKSGGYVVVLSTGDGVEQEAFFVLRAAKPAEKAKIALVVATSTWVAYNTWGGASSYTNADANIDFSDLEGARTEGFKPVLSTQRPWARGLIRLPQNFPRTPLKTPPPPGWAINYQSLEWTCTNGYSLTATSAGWAAMDSPTVRWLERNGYEVEYFSQHDLEQIPGVLDGYDCVITTGHDEYWSGPMRQALDDYIEAGGNYLRLGGNIFWQIRLENDGKTQVCYKYIADDADPVRNDPELKHTISACWEAKSLQQPAVTTFGANGTRGVYSRFGGTMPRSCGGFTVYRPNHWSMEGTDLYYGDVFGREVPVVGYEGDGIAYTFHRGLPYPTGEDGTPDHLEIVAMALATFEEEDHGHHGQTLQHGDGDLSIIATAMFGDDSEESRAQIRHGNVVVTSMTKGKGEVFCAGTTEWGYALSQRDFFCERITHNALKRFTKQ